MQRLIYAVLSLTAATAFAAAPAKAPTTPAATDKITGEVVDITCYTSHEASGAKHAPCAAKCISKGMPAGIVADGTLYVVTTSDHSTPASKLADLAGKTVVATGKKADKDGTHVFEIDSVQLAAAATPTTK